MTEESKDCYCDGMLQKAKAFFNGVFLSWNCALHGAFSIDTRKLPETNITQYKAPTRGVAMR